MIERKILHVLWNEESIYSKEFIEFIQNNYKESRHQFLILQSKKVHDISNALYVDCDSLRNCMKVAALIRKSEKTILHGIFMSGKLASVLTLFAPGKKMAWMIWGADLYSWRNKQQGPRAKLSNVIQKGIRQKVKSIIISFHPDYDEYLCQFKKPQTCFSAHYVLPYTKEELESNKQAKQDNAYHLLVGNSANKTLHHKEVLEVLQNSNNENFCIHIPLNYGDISYGDSIEELAKEKFGSASICYRQNIPIDKYMQLLWQMDGAVYDTDRQIALGNIIMLLYMEKTLYLRKGTPMYNYLKKQEVEVKEISDLSKALKPIKTDSHRGKLNEFVRSRLDLNEIKKQWSNVFEGVRNDKI